IQGIELLARSRAHGASHAEIVVLLAGAHFHGCRIEVRRMAPHDLDNRVHQSQLAPAHDLDRKVGRILDEALAFYHGSSGARMTRSLYAWYSAYMRLNSGPGAPRPMALPFSVTIARTSLVEEVSHTSLAPRNSDSLTWRT